MSAHICTITPEPNGFLVSCPHGCGLGDSAHAPSVTAAERRGELHRMATEPLITETRR